MSDNHFSEALEQAIEQTIFANVNTTLVGTIIAVTNLKKKLVTVQPAINRKLNGIETPWPPITNVPLILPTFGGLVIEIPKLALIGQSCLLIINQRSLEEWKSSASIKSPQDNRKFDINDCVAVPGLHNPNVPTGIKDDGNFSITLNKKSTFTMNAITGQIGLNGHLTVDV